ncbi:MAG: phage portal protein [Planctomycetota bacterium]
MDAAKMACGSVDVTSASPGGDVPAMDVSRRWEAARTTRLNEAHWAGSTPADTPLDVDIHEDLSTLRQRTRHEYHNNPHVEGCVATHAVDVVGAEGPRLEVISDNDNFNNRVEAYWREWSEICDYTGQMGLPELLQTRVRQYWFDGNHVSQDTNAKRTSTRFQAWDFPSTYRIHDITPTRMQTPFAMMGDASVAFGIRRDDDGVPLTYYFQKRKPHGASWLQTGEFEQVDAQFVDHNFLHHDPEQSIGYPLLSSALDTIAQIRDYDTHVMDAADLAASMSGWFVNRDPDGEKFQATNNDGDPIGFSVAEKRRVMRASPNGWDVVFPPSNQPTAEYVGHRKERQAEIGRAAAMPLMLIRLDSSGHNYSSARFDSGNYRRQLQNWQSWIARRSLFPMVRILVRDLQLAGELRRPPRGVRYVFHWDPPAEVDPMKSRGEEKIGLGNKTLSFHEACLRNGKDEDAVLASWSRTYRKLEAQGFTPEQIAVFMASWSMGKLPGMTGTGNNAAASAEQSPAGSSGVPNAAR